MKHIASIFIALSLCTLPAFGEDQDTSFTFTVTGRIISDTNTNAVFIQEKPTECEFDNTKDFKSGLPTGDQTFEITCPANIEQITLEFRPKSTFEDDELLVLVESRTIILKADDTQYTFEDVTFSEPATTPATTTTTDTTEHNTNTTSSCPACDDACKEKLHATDVYCDEHTQGWKPVTCEDGYEGYDLPTTINNANGESITYYEICLPNLLQEVVVTDDSAQTRIENLITQLANCIEKIEAPAP